MKSCRIAVFCVAVLFSLPIVAASEKLMAQSGAKVVKTEAAKVTQQAANNLHLTVKGIKKPTGNIVVAVYSGKKYWLSNKVEEVVSSATVVIKGNIKDGAVEAGFSLPPGEYAVSVFHDRDGDGKMKTNFLGIPKDPLGLSNGAKPKFGPPKYDDAKFQLTEKELALNIQLSEI